MVVCVAMRHVAVCYVMSADAMLSYAALRHGVVYVMLTLRQRELSYVGIWCRLL